MKENQDIQEEYELDDAQIYWRRVTIAGECAGDEDMFRQEYPSNDVEAFLVSGRPVLSSSRVFEMGEMCVPPKFTGWLHAPELVDSLTPVEFPVGDDGICVTLCKTADLEVRAPGLLEIWELPEKGHVYAIGADPAEGLDPEEANDPDASSAQVIDVQTHTVVAKLSGQMDTDIFGHQLALLGWLYKTAKIGPEINNTAGGAVLQVLKTLRYPNIYMTRKFDRHGVVITPRLGWKTMPISRELLVSDLVKAVRLGWIEVLSKETVWQLSTFVRDKFGKATAQVGEHDDDVISLAIAIQMAIVAAGYETLENWGQAEIGGDSRPMVAWDEGPQVPAKYTDTLAREGAIDDAEDLNEDDEE